MACLAGSRATFGLASGLLAIVGVLSLGAWPTVRLVLQLRAGTGSAVIGRRGLLVASVVPAALLVLAGAVLVRAPGPRTGSRMVDDIAFHPVIGHAPILTDEDRSRGLALEGTVGQRKHVPDPGRDQVLLLGDSVLYGWDVPDDSTSARLLERSLAPLQVLNASVSGFSPEQYLLYLDEVLRRPGVHPRYVVLGPYSGNDYHSCATSNWRGHSKPLFEMRDGRLANWRDVTPAWNCVDLLGGSLFFMPLWRWKEPSEAVINAICGNRVLDPDEHEAVVRALFLAIDARVREAGARMLVLLLPDRNDLEPGDTEYRRTLSRHDLLARILREDGLDTILFADAIRADGRDLSDLYLPGDAAHFSAAGHRLMAHTLEQALRERMGLPASASVETR